MVCSLYNITMVKKYRIFICEMLSLATGCLVCFGCLSCVGCTGYTGKRTMDEQRIKQISVPIQKEVSQQSLMTKGKIPTWLQGTFVRNGPVSVKIDDEKMAHWFDGLAMLHAFNFNQGNVTYTNKFLKTDAYNSVFMKGSLHFLGFDSLPPQPFWDRIKSIFQSRRCPPIQNANVNLTKIGNQYAALTEITLPVHFDVNNLNTLGALQFSDSLPHKNVFESAHPQHDRRTQEQFNYIVDFGLNSKYIVYKYHPEFPCRERIGKISVKKPAYMHSFALTEHYIILVEYPLVVNPIDLFFIRKPFIQNYRWIPERGTHFMIIDRRTGRLIKRLKTCQSFFAFHHVNAFEVGENIHLDIVTYKDASIVSGISQHGYLSTHLGYDEHLPSPRLTRFTISLKNDSLHSKVLFDGGSFELPRINEMYNAYPYCFAYGSDQRLLINSGDLRPIYKVDTKTGQVLTWQESGVLPGEPIFIASPNANAKAEDDGVILSIILNVEKQSAFLIILDAKTMKELGRALAPVTIPIGLHGQYWAENSS